MEAEAGGSCSPTHLFSLSRCPSLFCTHVGDCCSHGSWVLKDPTFPFLNLFDLVFGSKGSQEEELVVELL